MDQLKKNLLNPEGKILVLKSSVGWVAMLRRIILCLVQKATGLRMEIDLCRSVEDVRILHEILSCLRSSASSLADSVEKWEISYGKFREMCVIWL